MSNKTGEEWYLMLVCIGQRFEPHNLKMISTVLVFKSKVNKMSTNSLNPGGTPLYGLNWFFAPFRQWIPVSLLFPKRKFFQRTRRLYQKT